MPFLYLFCLAVLLCSCASEKRSSEAPGISKRMMMPDMNKKSPFEKAFNTGKDSNGKFFTSKGFKTGEYRGAGEYKTSTFVQANKLSRLGRQSAPMSKQENRWQNSTFGTKENRMGTQTANVGSQSYSGADQSYKTQDFQPASKSLNKDLRPQIYGESTATSAPAYTEEEISRLINR
jgi:hypothetical protein